MEASVRRKGTIVGFLEGSVQFQNVKSVPKKGDLYSSICDTGSLFLRPDFIQILGNFHWKGATVLVSQCTAMCHAASLLIIEPLILAWHDY